MSTPPDLPSALPPGLPPAAAPKRRFPRWLLIGLLITVPVMLIFCAIVGIGVLTLLGQRVDSTTGPRSVITSTDGHSQVSVPSSWSNQDDLNDKADLQVANPALEEYLIVLTESKADFVDTDLEIYAGLIRDGIVGAVSDASVSEARRLTINGMPAIQYEVSGSVDNLKVVYWLTAVEGRDHFHQVLGWTLGSKAEANREVILSVVESFQETGE
jgi:hypothetical protein